MAISDIVDSIPLATDTDGTMRVSGTRVTLDTIIAAFQAGATAEEITQQFSSVPLGDVYQVIGYFSAIQKKSALTFYAGSTADPG